MAARRARWSAPGARGAPVSERRLAYMRYVGQGHEITVPLPVRDLAADDARRCARHSSAIRGAVRRPIPGAAIEVLSWSVLVSTQAQRPERARAGRPSSARRRRTARRSFYDGRAGGTIEVPLYRREHMRRACASPGPALIAEDETSTFVAASFDARIDAAGCIVMDRKAADGPP